ncbi:hypothetical protein H0H87_008559 [Tephrocybe sp. NHM501043]|nr:hypothetical protein H0H87_008559 [Tephrocybe sp. NHM501043]
MKYLLIVALFICAQASARTFGNKLSSSTLQARTCGDPTTTVPLFRAYSAANTDHLYTTNATEIQSVVKAGTYTDEGTVGRIFATQELGTVPFYRFYSIPLTDHFYTTDESEGLDAGYAFEGIVGYVYPGTVCGGTPFYRLLLPAPKTDHFYTTQGWEVTYAETGGYIFEGVAAYIFLA